MNTQSWLSAQPCWKIAVARLRAGFTDVLSTGMVMRWITVSMSPTVTPVKPGDIDLRLVLAITNTNSAGEDDLGQHHRRELEPARRVRAVTVRREPARLGAEARVAVRDHEDDRRADDAADHLAADVERDVARLRLAQRPQARRSPPG